MPLEPHIKSNYFALKTVAGVYCSTPPATSLPSHMETWRMIGPKHPWCRMQDAQCSPPQSPRSDCHAGPRTQPFN